VRARVVRPSLTTLTINSVVQDDLLSSTPTTLCALPPAFPPALLLCSTRGWCSALVVGLAGVVPHRWVASRQRCGARGQRLELCACCGRAVGAATRPPTAGGNDSNDGGVCGDGGSGGGDAEATGTPAAVTVARAARARGGGGGGGTGRAGGCGRHHRGWA